MPRIIPRPVGAGQDHGVAVGIAQPDFPMVGAAVARGRIAMARHQHVRLHPLRAGDRGIDVVDLEPEQHAVAVRLDGRIADRAVMMLDPPSVQLQDQGVARNQALVFGAAVGAAAAEQILVPPAARFDVADGDEGLWTQLNLCTLGPAGSLSPRAAKAIADILS